MNQNRLELTVSVKQLKEALNNLPDECENNKVFFVNFMNQSFPQSLTEETNTFNVFSLTIGHDGEILLWGDNIGSHFFLCNKEAMKVAFPLPSSLQPTET